MKLTIPDRIHAFGLLPDRGDIATLRALDALKTKLSFTDQELEFFAIKPLQGADGSYLGYQWDKSASGHEFDIDLTPNETRIVADALKVLETRKELPIQALSLWEKFIEA